MAEKVLVTGATGYIGSILCEHLLAAGYTVTAVDNLMYGEQRLFHLCANERFNFVRADARNEQVMTDVVRGANVITLRLATVFGMSPRMRLDLLVNHFVYAAVTDSYIVIFEKDFKRNYIHIRDVADCFIHCIRNADSMRGRAFNAGLDDANLSK